MADELKLKAAQMRDIAAAIEAAGVLGAKPNAKPEDALPLYLKIRGEIEKKGMAPQG
ncbi:MAG TPA: hypothetical protein VHL34_19675 [Rhizomicrobium sp.]|jgi:hypothetical protein|nr:hypothetical protein [Rhizomicrobium sp.]